MHTSLPVKPQLSLLLLLPSLSDRQEPECLEKDSSHNESQFTSETLRLRNHTEQNRRCAGLNMNTTALGQVV